MKRLDYIKQSLRAAIEDVHPLRVSGRVLQVQGTIIKAVVPSIKLGELCILRNPGEDFELRAEVVGFSQEAALLTPIGEMNGISTATEVIPTGKMHSVGVGPGLLGRVLNGMGQPLDTHSKGPLKVEEYYPVYQDAPDPLSRQ
ncbi:MAG: EscN/YscN/HrcN family type III secretion system ATPase, partial [Methylocystaceae bacterium]|nr:EscN/YscN/HrcN family type III secretion system ATPase [Methylocystaceae bacterium]